MKTAFITGITGQDGSYLAEYLLSKGYLVHGLIRKSSTFNTKRIDHIFQDIHEEDLKLILHYGDLSDSSRITNLIHTIKPDEIYNLGAQSHVGVSFLVPEYTTNITATGTTRLLEVIRNMNSEHMIKFYQASSSEMFGDAEPPQNLTSPFRPRSPYAVSKLYSYWMTKIYRDGHGLFAANGILFNHESPRRGETFVTRKITRAIARIIAKKQKHLYLGNLEARRDWGYAPDYVESMWRILQQKEAKDYVIGTGQTHSVKEFLEEAFTYANLNYNDYVKIDSRYFRPLDVENLICDSSDSVKELNWKPKIGFKELVRIMVDADMEAIGLESPGEGEKVIKQTFSEKWWSAP